MLLLALFLAQAGPASALIQPRLLDWQARLSRLLPERVRVRAARASDALPLTAMPEDLRQVLSGLSPGIPPEPVELFAGIRLLLRRDETLVRFDERVDLYDESLRLLREYRQDVNEALRLAPGGPAGPPLPPAQEGLPKPETRPEGVHALRLLPHPRPTTPRARLRLFLEAAGQDVAALQQRRDEADQARAVFRDSTMAWRWHLRRLADSLDPQTGAPAPPVESVTTCADPPVEQIPPPPPLDLPELPDVEEVDPLEPDEARPPSAPGQQPPGEERPSPPGGSGTEGGGL